MNFDYGVDFDSAAEFKEFLDIVCEASQKYGIRHFKLCDLDLTFTAQQPKIVLASSELPNQGIGETFGMPTEDELLFASSIPMTQDEIEARPPA